jgi:3-(methylthio)propionyl---CoA ligase
MLMIDGGMQPFALTLDKFLSHAAKWHPQAQVVTACESGESNRIGYAYLKLRSLRISAVLVALKARAGDRIATLAWNSQGHVEVWYAVMGMGAICHTLNPRLLTAQLVSMVTLSEARILFVSADLAPVAREIAESVPGIEHILIVDSAADDTVVGRAGKAVIGALEPLIAQAEGHVPWGDFDETSPSGLCFTSGTTGAPKGVTYTHRSSFLHTLRLLQTDVMAISVADSVLAVVPMFHANGWGLPFAVPAAGARLVLPGRHADGAKLARLIAAEDVTVGVGVPTVWLGLLEHVEASGENLPSLQRIIMGGAPLAAGLMTRIEERLGVVIQTSWGMTELSPSGTVAPRHLRSRSATASGRPAVGVDLLITDAAGQALPQQRDAEGHLRVRGAAVIERYFGETEPTRDADGWFPTGDLARIDAQGNLLIVGRAKDLIKSGGEWINPVEIESLIGALPEVALAAVIGRVDPKWGERPILLVQMRGEENVTDETLLAPLRGRVASWWIPDAIFRLQHMPLASTGKIDKMALRAEYGDGLNAQENPEARATPYQGGTARGNDGTNSRRC